MYCVVGFSNGYENPLILKLMQRVAPMAPFWLARVLKKETKTTKGKAVLGYTLGLIIYSYTVQVCAIIDLTI
jgi:AraC-like DNA-binding protein